MFVDDWLTIKVDGLSDDSLKISDKNRVIAILIDEIRKDFVGRGLLRLVVGSGASWGLRRINSGNIAALTHF